MFQDGTTLPRKSTLKRYEVQKGHSNNLVFNISKTYQNDHNFFCLSKSHQNMCSYIILVLQLNCTKKPHRNNLDFSSIEIGLKKVRRNDVNSSLIEITSKKVRGNDVHFSLIEIASKKICQNDVDFSSIEIRSKMYVEMTWKFINIFFSAYRRNIDIK